jgi:hypothetical protein
MASRQDIRLECAALFSGKLAISVSGELLPERIRLIASSKLLASD